MIAPHYREILIQDPPPAQLPLALHTEGVLRYVWSSRFGPMLIEVRDGLPFVNGKPVQPADRDLACCNPLPPPGEPT